MAKIAVKIVAPSDRAGPLIDRKVVKGAELVTADANSSQPLPITQEEYDFLTA